MSPADLLVTALEQGRAFRVLHFKKSDGPVQEFYIVDGKRHIERIPCAECKDTPRIQYSHNTDGDGMKLVYLRCQCGRNIVLAVGAHLFDKARGAMTSAINSWWNCWSDPVGHPDDLGAVGGIVADAHAMDVLLDAAEGSDDPSAPRRVD